MGHCKRGDISVVQLAILLVILIHSQSQHGIADSSVVIAGLFDATLFFLLPGSKLLLLLLAFRPRDRVVHAS